MKNFFAPQFLNFKFYDMLFESMKNFPDMFRKDCKIVTLYGCFPGMKWNAGRIEHNRVQLSENKVRGLFEFYKHYNMPLTITATKQNMTPELLEDEYCHMIMRLTLEYNGAVLVANKELENLLRQRYPDLKLHCSILQTEFRPYNLDGYAISVLDVDKNKEWDFLNTIPMEDRDRIEILVNECCDKNCPKRFDHYRYMSKCDETGVQAQPWCALERSVCGFARRKKNGIYISPDELDNYVKAGFNKFKLIGRGHLYSLFQSIAEYLGEPEYYDDIMRSFVLWSWNNNQKEN